MRPIVGRLEDLTTACLTTFHHSADTFALKNEDGSLPAVPQLDPPPYSQLSIDREMEKGYPPMGLVPGNLRHTLGEGARTPLLLRW